MNAVGNNFDKVPENINLNQGQIESQPATPIPEKNGKGYSIQAVADPDLASKKYQTSAGEVEKHFSDFNLVSTDLNSHDLSVYHPKSSDKNEGLHETIVTEAEISNTGWSFDEEDANDEEIISHANQQIREALIIREEALEETSQFTGKEWEEIADLSNKLGLSKLIADKIKEKEESVDRSQQNITTETQRESDETLTKESRTFNMNEFLRITSEQNSQFTTHQLNDFEALATYIVTDKHFAFEGISPHTLAHEMSGEWDKVASHPDFKDLPHEHKVAELGFRVVVKLYAQGYSKISTEEFERIILNFKFDFMVFYTTKFQPVDSNKKTKESEEGKTDLSEKKVIYFELGPRQKPMTPEQLQLFLVSMSLLADTIVKLNGARDRAKIDELKEKKAEEIAEQIQRDILFHEILVYLINTSEVKLSELKSNFLKREISSLHIEQNETSPLRTILNCFLSVTLHLARAYGAQSISVQ